MLIRVIIILFLSCNYGVVQAAVQTSDPLLVVVIMVKDEEPVVAQTLQPFVDGGVRDFFVFDTGSTDKTIEVTQEFFKANNIERGHIAQEPFIDFATSRNRAFELAQQKFPDAVFIIMPDAEWYIHNVDGLLRFCQSHINDTASSYLMRWTSSTQDSLIPRLIRCKSDAHFEGKRHEVVCPVVYAWVPRDVYFNVQVSRYGAEKSRKRWERDLEDLLQEYYQNPASSRAVFYIAQTYECLGDLHNAFFWYKKRIEMRGWDEEDYVAMYRFARVFESMDTVQPDEWPLIMDYYLKAYTMRPHRAESLVKIAEYYWKIGNYPLCFLFAKRAAELPYPEHDMLFIEKHVYDYVRFEVLGKCAWYIGEYGVGEWAVRKALEARPDLVHLHRNLTFYINRKEQQQRIIPCTVVASA